MQQIYHKKNELFEVEFFKDKECTEAFDFTNAKNLYIELKDGDITSLYILKDKYYWRNVYTPYMPHNFSCEPCDNIITLDDITPNLSKYIPEDNAVLFLSEEDKVKYCNVFERNVCIFSLIDLETWNLKYLNNSGNMETPKKATIFLTHGTQSEIQKANEVEKELEEKYGVEEVSLFVLHCFVRGLGFLPNTPNILSYIGETEINCISEYKFLDICFNKIITTNSTGILKPEDSKERLQIIDAKEIFEEYSKTQR